MNKFPLKLALCVLIFCAVDLSAASKKKSDPDLSAEIFDEDIDESVKKEKIEQAKAKYKGPLRYWGSCVNNYNPNGSLRTVDKIFKKFGFSAVNGSKGDNWDVLWSVEYPFKSSRGYPELLKSMEDYVPRITQKINHFPGIQRFTDKRNLAKYTRSSFLLPTFVFPEHNDNFTQFRKTDPTVQIIEKNLRSGGVRMIDASEVDVKNDKKIYQAFMDSPFLIDDHAFDLGVYVVVTSMNPLRIYRYDDVLMRFCQKEFFPFDRYDTARYVVDDNHISAFDMPAFREQHTKYGYSVRQIFDNFVRDNAYSVDKFWKHIDHAINDVIPQHEPKIMEKVRVVNCHGSS
jgi:tubulin monoglycylase TTLL15